MWFRWCVWCFCLVLVVACAERTPPLADHDRAAQVVKALERGDMTTLLSLTDPAMPQRDMVLLTEIRTFQERQEVHPTYFTAIGPFESFTVQEMRQQGATTVLPVVLHHASGRAELSILLGAAPEYLIVGLESRVLEREEAP